MNNIVTWAALVAAMGVPALAQQVLNTPEDIANEQITVIALVVQALGSQDTAAAKAEAINELTERLEAVNAAKQAVDKAELEAVEREMLGDRVVQQVLALFAGIVQQQAAEQFGGSPELRQAVMGFLQACSEGEMGEE